MFRRFYLLFPAALWVFATFPTGSVAQTVDASASARLIYPATVQKVEDMDFGTVSATAAGTVIIDPNSDTTTTTGGVSLSGGAAHSALFRGAARKRTVVNIRIPKTPIQLQRAGGTEQLTVSNWTLQGQDKRDLAAQTTFDFRVGATLTVPANVVEGSYTGTFDVDVQYP